jgi:hypothetical protein
MRFVEANLKMESRIRGVESIPKYQEHTLTGVRGLAPRHFIYTITWICLIPINIKGLPHRPNIITTLSEWQVLDEEIVGISVSIAAHFRVFRRIFLGIV